MPVERRELWIVLESADPSAVAEPTVDVLTGELGRHVLAGRQVNPARQPTPVALRSGATMLFELAHLTPDARRQLAEDAARVGRAANPGYLVVKDILSGHASAAQREAFQRSWPPETVRAETAQYEVLAFCCRPLHGEQGSGMRQTASL